MNNVLIKEFYLLPFLREKSLMVFKIDGIVITVSEIIKIKPKEKFDTSYCNWYLYSFIVYGINNIIIIIFIKALIQEYIKPFLILPIVTKKSNIMLRQAIREGNIKIIPNSAQPSALMLCRPHIKPNKEKINPNPLHIIDIIFVILFNFIYNPSYNIYIKNYTLNINIIQWITLFVRYLYSNIRDIISLEGRGMVWRSI